MFNKIDPRTPLRIWRPAGNGGFWFPKNWYDSAKTTLDFLLGVILFALALPVLLLAGLLVKLTSPGPVLYKQTRLGKNGRPYTLYKLRSMRTDSERNGACWSIPGDPRITPIGRFLRASHLDELPQLINVLRGEMSLVGPRPERPEFIPTLEKSIPRYRERLKVRPGVTGLAQVQLPADTDLESVRKKLLYDLYYVKNCGIWLDLRVILATAFKMFGVPFRVLGALFFLPRVGEAPTRDLATGAVLAPSASVPELNFGQPVFATQLALHSAEPA